MCVPETVTCDNATMRPALIAPVSIYTAKLLQKIDLKNFAAIFLNLVRYLPFNPFSD